MKLRYIIPAFALLALIGFYTATVYGADSGFLPPGTMADDATVGTVAWASPDNAKLSDNTYTTNTGFSVHSHYLKGTNFGFTVPSGATIDGIEVAIERKASTGGSRDVRDDDVKIVKADGTIGTEDKASATLWGTTEITVTYGTPTDLWSETWTDTDINDADFGVVLAAHVGAQGGGIDVANVDLIQIKVYYTEAAPASVAATTAVRTAQVQVRTGSYNNR